MGTLLASELGDTRVQLTQNFEANTDKKSVSTNWVTRKTVLFQTWNQKRRSAKPKTKLPISDLCQYYTQTSYFDKMNLLSVSVTSDSQPKKRGLRGPVGSWFNELPGLRRNPFGLRIGGFKSPSHSKFQDVHRSKASFSKFCGTQNGTFSGLKPGTTVGWTKEEVTYLWTMSILYSNFIFLQIEPISYLR